MEEESADFAQALALIMDKSKGMFLYTKFVFEDQLQSMADDASDKLTLAQVEALPDGMEAYYLQTLQRHFPSVPKDKSFDGCKVLQVVFAANTQLTIQQIAAILGKTDVKVYGKITKLKSLFPLLQQTQDPSQAIVTVYHKSIRDWMCKPETAKDHPQFFVDEVEGHRRLTKAAVRVLGIDNQQGQSASECVI